MTAIPTLRTDRLLLRPFTPRDAPTVRLLAGAAEVAATTLHIPHPYPAGAAEAWIDGHAEAAAAGRAMTWAIARDAGSAVLGAIGIHPVAAHNRAEIGYWLGVPYWGQGYMTEAARRVVAFGFEEIGLHRVQATCLPRNKASSRVMEKAGMTYEGLLRGYVRKAGVYEDLAMYAVLHP
ncbi:MAG: GNAT family protein [Chloroflexota bacterium]